MLYKALDAHIKSGKLEPCYVVKGDDPYLRVKAIEKLSAVVNNPIFNLGMITAADSEEEVVSSLRVLPLGDDFRMLTVGEFGGGAAATGGKKIIEYLKEPEPLSVLVINDRGGKIYDNIARHAQVIECDKLTIKDLTDLITERVKDIEYNAAVLVAEYCGRDTGRIVTECDKLIDYADGNRITAQMVEAVVHKDAEYKIFEFTGALSDKNTARAYQIWGELKRSDPGGMLSALLNHFRRLLYVAVSGVGDAELAAGLGVRAEAIRHYRRSGQNFTPMKLKKITDYIHSRDYLIKSGEMSADTAINNTLLQILNI